MFLLEVYEAVMKSLMDTGLIEEPEEGRHWWEEDKMEEDSYIKEVESRCLFFSFFLSFPWFLSLSYKAVQYCRSLGKVYYIIQMSRI